MWGLSSTGRWLQIDFRGKRRIRHESVRLPPQTSQLLFDRFSSLPQARQNKHGLTLRAFLIFLVYHRARIEWSDLRPLHCMSELIELWRKRDII